ncbi:MMB_0454 family protein [Mycoplasma tauri]|uniref:Uncharacterized protein n=1 Tax=Mycoplasma tauri TaxID=547987 RepID=A0A953NEA7_9MOLU|nr:hypothetical protein [Mycoplasma tauri]MBZ4195368.1 hypothetical protein [Mycoplasma tauri]MBZ4203770.1 hypothetical protein [Mycoplasma tauri]MBZ4204521.1 hypothetical protein [Mycoplasma tauri]MBZ4212502.1 hypothetical protein [Mycoplasma tauri]MBZ4218260.1 hypothetical protein [Mycoplasma tauri]
MNFITTLNGINERVSIYENAFLDLIKHAINNSKVIKLANSPRIIFFDDKINASFVIDITIKAKTPLKETIDNFTNEIINGFDALLNYKPNSVKVCFTGYF